MVVDLNKAGTVPAVQVQPDVEHMDTNKAGATRKAWSQAEIEKGAHDFKTGVERAKNLGQELTIGALQHIAEHGNYMVIIPVADAMYSANKGMFDAWVAFVQRHSFLVFNQKADGKPKFSSAELREKLKVGFSKDPKTGVYLGGMAEAWRRDNRVSKAESAKRFEAMYHDRPVGRPSKDGTQRTVANLWHEYKREPAKRAVNAPINVSQMVANFIGKLQSGIENDSLQDSNGKPLSYNDVCKICDELSSKLKRKSVTVNAKAKPVTNVTSIKTIAGTAKRVPAAKAA